VVKQSQTKLMENLSQFNNQISPNAFLKKWNLLIVIGFLVSLRVDAATYTETSISALQSRINNSSTISGDIITLADATYTGSFTINKSGITIRAVTNGGVTLIGSSSVTMNCSNSTLSGFQFKNGNVGTVNVVETTGNANKIIQCNFFNIIAHNYININAGSANNEITNCNIEGKPATMNAGPTIQINTSPTIISYTKIRYCTFMNAYGLGGDFGNEPIRIGLGAEQNNISATVVEYCYFENLGLGDSETISVKSTGNVIRYNTFNNNPKGQLVFRSGSNGTAYGNFFINSGGIRIKEGQNHMIYNNYFEGAGDANSLEIMNYIDNPVATVYVYHNTFYNPGKITMGGAGLYPPTNVKFVNNLIYKSTSGSILSDLNANVSYTNNMFFGGASLGRTFTVAEFSNSNPLLILNTSNYYSLSSTSPALNNANGTYTNIVDNLNVDDDPNLLLDIDRQARPADKTQKDVGANEFTTGIITNKPLTRDDAGPSYLSSVLPVKLSSFNVYLENQKQVKLVWTTLSETNNNYFTLSKSTDGKTFIPLTNVPSKGNGATYKIEDFEPFSGINYYKLSQTDLDGKTEELGIKTIKLSDFKKASFLVYPNPTINGIINIKNQNVDGLQKLEIYNLAGKKILSDKVNFTNGKTSYKIKEQLTKGVYILKIGNETLTSRLVIE
jgi:hypothetical protein